MTRRQPSELPDWPRLLSRDLAAAYVGISAGSLPLVPVPVVRIGSRVLYDRKALDAFVDTMSPADAASGASDDEWLSRLG